MRIRTSIGRAAILIALVALASPDAHAQGIAGRLKAKVKERVDGKLDDTVQNALDQIENAAKCPADDDSCAAEAKKDGKKVVLTDDEGKILPPEKQPKDSPAKNADAVEAANARAAGAKAEPAGAPASEAAAPAKESKPGQGAWANYDFIPGERVLFSDDFSADRVGNFPKRLELIVGNMEVVDAKGVRYVRATSDSKFAVNLPETLPQRFTLEFDLTMPWNGMIVYPGPDGTTNDPVFDLSVHK